MGATEPPRDVATGSHAGSRLIAVLPDGEVFSLAVGLHGAPYEVAQQGRGVGLRLGSIPHAPRFLFGQDGRPTALRLAEDSALALEINHRRMETDNQLSLWSSQGHRDWACKFTVGGGLIRPAGAQHLCVGIKGGGGENRLELVLVASTDVNRRLTFIPDDEAAAEERETPLPFDDAGGVLLIDSPPCAWLGAGRKAIGLRGGAYDAPAPADGTGHGGRGRGIGIVLAERAVPFVLEGSRCSHVLRLAEDSDLALEVNHRRMDIDNPLSLWSISGHRDWACRFSLGPDGTIAPAVGHNGGRPVVLGIKGDKSRELVLVDHEDHERRIIVSSGTSLQDYREELEAIRLVEATERQEMEAQAIAAASPGMRQRLVEDGFFRLEGAVPQRLVRAARQEINRQLGSSASSADHFKGKASPDHPAITDLFNRSMLPFVLRELLGGDQPFSVHRGQIALRFPGDMCPDGTCDFSPEGFENVRKHWHIDGCPSEFIPGVTDHWGTIKNFDALVGVILSDIPEKMSGEVAFYPGSHDALAQHFRDHSGRELERVRQEGNRALPIGERTDATFGNRSPTHVTGRAGDVVIANYMTAHFVAPNTAVDVRYAVY